MYVTRPWSESNFVESNGMDGLAETTSVKKSPARLLRIAENWWTVQRNAANSPVFTRVPLSAAFIKKRLDFLENAINL